MASEDLDAALLDAPDRTRGRIHETAVDTIGAWVLGGRYKPGEGLPTEDVLAATLSVSRTSVREAVRVLSAKGLLESCPRTGVRVRVRDREHWGACSIRSSSPGTRTCPATRNWSRA